MAFFGSDDNHDEMVREAEKFGASTLDLRRLARFIKGVPDLLVAFRGRVAFWEVKNPKTDYGRAGLTWEQKVFRAKWSAVPFYEIRTRDDARRALGV